MTRYVNESLVTPPLFGMYVNEPSALRPPESVPLDGPVTSCAVGTEPIAKMSFCISPGLPSAIVSPGAPQ